MTGTIWRAAPAKINLALHVTGRRSDGYHLIESLSVFTGHGDRLAAAPAGSDGFLVEGPFALAVPLGADNLVLRARDALREASPGLCPPVALSLEKNLPAASGMGGGSSDAAAALLALAELWRLPLPPEQLGEIGLSLGADIPMCLAGRPLIARGIGEAIDPIDRFPSLPLVLVNPGVAVSTPDVFRALSSPDGAPLPLLPQKITREAILDWLSQTRNDLQTPSRSLRPEIDAALRALRKAGAAFARMSGSGATCFGIFADEAEARQAAETIIGQHPGWFVVATRSLGTED